MIMIDVETKKWGNSLGVILPKEIAEKEHIKESDKVKLIILRESSKTLKETFGLLKGKLDKTSQQIKDELRRELDG